MNKHEISSVTCIHPFVPYVYFCGFVEEDHLSEK